MTKQVTLLTGLPVIAVIADMRIDFGGVREMARWIKDRRPGCLPDDYDPDDEDAIDRVVTPLALPPEAVLFPHGMFRQADNLSRSSPYEVAEALDHDPRALLTHNELLVELAGRKCYDSFGLKADRKSNAEYIAHTQEGEIPHRSIAYHAKMSFFFAGISRRVSHELIRNYVGADRDEEGAPSQESTRYTEHHGRYVVHPRDVRPSTPNDHTPDLASFEIARFRELCQENYEAYLGYVARQNAALPPGEPPKGLARKRILEAASQRLMHAVETSFVWTTNPMALTKLLVERDNPAADLEFQRFARLLKYVSVRRWPNLFPRWADGMATLNTVADVKSWFAPFPAPNSIGA